MNYLDEPVAGYSQAASLNFHVNGDVMNRWVRSVVISAVASCLSAYAMAALPDSGMWAMDGELNGKPGRGIQIDRQGGLNVIVTYFGYRTDGSALFLQAAGQLKDEKIFEGELTEYRGGRVLGGPAQDGEPVRVVGPVRIVFDTETSATVTLPGEAPQPMKRFGFEDNLARMHGKSFSYSSGEELVMSGSRGGQLHIYAKGDVFRMEEEFAAGGTCFYEGPLRYSGGGIYSEGLLSCKGAPSRSGLNMYRIERLHVDEYGVLTGRIHWSGVDAAGQLVQPVRTVLGFCHSSAAVMLTPMPCLGGGKNYYQAERH